MSKTLCIIGARGGSKGLPKKNSRMLYGLPLIAWSIKHAKACEFIDNLVVSTDCPIIQKIAIEYEANAPFLRPPILANDSCGKWEVWQHALNECEKTYNVKYDTFVDLDCTSPLRDPIDIIKAYNLYNDEKCDGVFSICKSRKNPYFNMVEKNGGFLSISKSLGKKIVSRQEAPDVYDHVASIYILNANYVRSGSGLLSGNMIGYDIGEEKSFDIDSELDFKIVEFLMGQKLKTNE